jgi:hypothetical protein
MDMITLDTKRIRDIRPEVLDSDGRMRVLPAAYWANTTVLERALFGHRNGIYSFPTTELVHYLRKVIGDRRAIEIGAGHGVLAQALEIPATDSYQQDKQPYRLVYEATGQPRVRYGPNVIDCDASRAVRLFKPEVVIGCWVTHVFDPARPGAKGNEAGVDEEDILHNTQTYVAIGDSHVHRHKKIWGRSHTLDCPPFLYSRAHNGSRQFIATWPGQG